MKLILSTKGHKVLKPEQELLKKVVDKVKKNHKNFKSKLNYETIVFQDSKLIIKSTITGDVVLCFNKEDHDYRYIQVDTFRIDDVLDYEDLIKNIFNSTTNTYLKVDLYREYFELLHNNTEGFLLEKAEWF